MENKLIKSDLNQYEHENHPNVRGVHVINGKNNFPISWLNQQGYCEWQLYLQYVENVKVGATKAMLEGTAVHNQLEEEFMKTAEEITLDDAIDLSRKTPILSREVFVMSENHGIRGYIDEIRITPSEILIIDDKPGTTPYESTKNQVKAYCLAFKELVGNDGRKIKGALRQRGTDNIFWCEEFDIKTEEEIKELINRMDSLFDGKIPYGETKNKQKCKSCRYQSYCKHHENYYNPNGNND